MRRMLLAFGVLLLVVGCSQSTRIQSTPEGARTMINGTFAGITPFVYEVSRSEWPADNVFEYRMDREGFLPKEGEFRGTVAVGRIIGSIFYSGGLSLAWSGVMALPEVEIELETLPMDGPSEGRTEATTATVQERLQKVDDLYDQGLISEREHRRLRSSILEGL